MLEALSIKYFKFIFDLPVSVTDWEVTSVKYANLTELVFITGSEP